MYPAVGNKKFAAQCLRFDARGGTEGGERGHRAFLVRSGLLIKDKNGLRQLTQEGLDHLSKSRQQDV